MSKLIQKAKRPARFALPLISGFALVVMTVSAFGVAFPFQFAKADVGTITISGIGSGPNYSGFGTWAPVGGQKCYNQGNGFRYYIEVFEDSGNNGVFDSGTDVVKQVVDPAPCGDQFDVNNPPSADLTGGGDWPATGQTPSPASFTLPGGTHYFCSVLRHVSKSGNDIVATSCLNQPVVVEGPEPHLTISKTDSHDTAAPGDVLTYQITVTDTSIEVGAGAVQVTDTVPANLTNITNISDSGVLSSGVITWDISFLSAGTSKTLTYQGTVDPNLPVGTTILVNTAQLGCSQVFIDAFAQCNYVGTAVDTTSVTVEAPVLPPVLTISKLDTPDPVADDANLTYTINYSVATTGATGVVITDVLPGSTTFVSAANGGTYNSATNTVTWNLGTVAIGSYSTTLVVHVAGSVADGSTITNTATIDTSENDPLSASQTTTVKRTDPALSIAKVVNVSFANPGDTILYTVTVTNTGTDTARNLVVTDTLPAGFTFVENGASTMSKPILNDLAPGASANVTFQVKVGAGATAGTFDNVATATGTGVGPVSAQAALEIRVPQVLGEQVEVKPQVKGATLPNTGASPLDLGQLGLAALSLLGGTALVIRRRK